MPTVNVQRDTLDEENRRFDQQPLSQPVFLNSVPKSGSHLLRNIVRMFVPVEQQYDRDFIQWANLQHHRAAFDPRQPMLSWGHLFFADASAIETASARRILLVRDPYDWVIARARFFLSEQFDGNMDFLRSGALDADAGFALAERLFGQWQAPATPMPQLPANRAGTPAGPRVIVVDNPASDQSAVAVAMRGISRSDSDYFPLVLANSALGGSSTARLFQEVRVRRALSYGANSVLPSYRDEGALFALVGPRTS